MKKDIIIGVLLLILGIVIGVLCRPEHFRDATKMIQIDTVYETKYYSRLELANNTYKLDVPKIGRQEYIYVAADSAAVIYKDSIKYVMLPREYYYTSIDDVEIWHSGVDSVIDSLSILKQTATITKTETVVQSLRNWRFSADIGANVGRCGVLYIAPNLSAELGYKRWALTGEIGCNLEVQPDALLLPRGYVELGLKYSLTKR